MSNFVPQTETLTITDKSPEILKLKKQKTLLDPDWRKWVRVCLNPHPPQAQVAFQRVPPNLRHVRELGGGSSSPSPASGAHSPARQRGHDLEES